MSILTYMLVMLLSFQPKIHTSFFSIVNSFLWLTLGLISSVLLLAASFAASAAAPTFSLTSAPDLQN